MSQRATIDFREETLGRIGPTQEGGLSLRIAAMLARYEGMTRALLAEIDLSEAEWCAVMDASSGGTDLNLGGDAPFIPTMAWAKVRDTRGLSEKWDVDQAALVKRLQALSPAQQWAIDEAVSRCCALPGLETEEALRSAWIRV